jgi:hypothetical protein
LLPKRRAASTGPCRGWGGEEEGLFKQSKKDEDVRMEEPDADCAVTVVRSV